MLTETLVPLLSLTSKKGLVTIASKIYIFAHMLMPVSVFSTSRMAYKQKKSFPFCMPKFYLSSKNPQQKEGK